MRARILAEENRKWWTLGALAFALFMIMLDNTVVNVALPSIQRDLGVSTANLEWTVNAYTLTFAVLLVTGGRLADLCGRRRVFFVGSAIFASMSLAGGVAQSEAWLIAVTAIGTSCRLCSRFCAVTTISSRPPLSASGAS